MKNFTPTCFSFLFTLFFCINLPTLIAQDLWSDPMTWSALGLAEPADGENVMIPAGASILLDEDSPNLGVLTIHGELLFDEQNLQLSAQRIDVMGLLQIGTEGNPFMQQAIITLTGPNDAASVAMGSRGIRVMGGRLELHGTPPAIPWSKINANAAAGSTQLSMMETVDWQVNDQIIIGPTDYYSTPPTQATTLSTVVGTQVTIPAPGLNAQRWGALQYATPDGMSLSPANLVTPPAASGFTPTVLDERAPVGNLTRNIVIQSIDDALWQGDSFGAHIMVMRMNNTGDMGIAHIDGLEIRRGGQEGNLGRYPFHWHMLSYFETQTLGDATGQYFRNSVVNESRNRGIVVHGTNGVSVRDNIIYNILGHGIFTEDASERRNTFDGNLVLHVRNGGLKIHESGATANRGASGFWISNPDNTFTNNTAADCGTNGFWLAFPDHPFGLSSQIDITPNAITFGIFDNNTAHSNRLEGIMMDFREIDELGDIQPRQYFSTSNGVYPSAPYSNVRRFAMPRFSTWKNGSRGVWDRTAAIDIFEVISADNCGRFFAGSGAAGVIERSLIIGTSLNYLMNGVGRPNFTGETPPAAFATYHSAFSIRDNIVVNFPEVSGEMSGAFATNDYYLRPVEKGHIRSPNNLLIDSHPGVKMEAQFDFFSLASAFWDPHAYWGGNPGQYLVYDIPFLTFGQTPTPAPGAVTGGVLVDGPFFGVYEFVVNLGNNRNNDLMAIEVNRLDTDFSNVGTWTVDQAPPGEGLAHMRDFSAHPSSYYTLEFPTIDNITDVAMTFENMATDQELIVLAVEFDGSQPIGQVYTSTRYNYADEGHTAAGTYAHKHLYQPVGSRQAVIDSDGENYWQDVANNLIWIKVQGGIEQESWNPADFSATDDELLYWEFFLRVTEVTNAFVVLPVNFIDFSAKAQTDKTVLLDWTTASEINNDYFTVQRSANGETWQDLGKVAGLGTLNATQNYTYVDQNPLQEKAYYRLQQTDVDGTIAYSSIQTVYVDRPQKVTVFPNPVSDFLQVTFQTIPTAANIEIMNSNGQVLLVQEMRNFEDDKINVSSLNSGLYFIKITTDKGSDVLSFVK